ncbi:MAG: hypothetical protein HY319_07760 [Armatimonadetes bacterium]|nr:hypothetical protein [Armatimonadota bacterium]
MSETHAQTQPQNQWLYWESGLLATVMSLITTPSEAPEYLLLGLVALLFFWGFVRE